MERQTLAQTAFSMHGFCFICKRKNTRLYKVNQASIIYAYKRHHIYIKQHARCCYLHLDNQKNIKYEEYINIPTRLVPQNRQIILLLDCISLSKSLSIFDRFKDIATMDENLCINIKGSKKAEIIRFSSCITSIKDTNDRTKDQLIALYRFWLRRGHDHASIANLKSNTSRQQISHYLSQIREAINKDIVPYFLGCKHLNRNMFIKHNNKTTIELNNMEDDELAVIADGIYCRIEKSSNNSLQKKKNRPSIQQRYSNRIDTFSRD